jgi:hypothetical protein
VGAPQEDISQAGSNQWLSVSKKEEKELEGKTRSLRGVWPELGTQGYWEAQV